MKASTLRTIAASLLLFWLVSLTIGVVMTAAQPDQLGVPEAYIYWRLVGEGPSWAFFLALGFLYLASTEGEEKTVREGDRIRWIEWRRSWPLRIRAAGRFVLGAFVVFIAAGFLLGGLGLLKPYNPVVDEVFRAVCEPPAWIAAVALIASLWGE